ncbi:hypothetical protein K402DRAFT_443636 [Aulographum hederae CBS 113979]|uniref:CNH domain-containing protein n=1 Tax=Aulographum hederae CBS 113979 TaxID=1176131 RepID=A0A6G1HEW5_9PEZI|nr:hypothetical protein K402DRAFT_443636 [Aulographum hederae CBS 113979]
MLSAFTARPIVELKQRDKSKIESILAYGDRLLVGLNTGSLRIYRVNEQAEDPDTTPENGHSESQNGTRSTKARPVDLLREEEKFSRRPIQQLAIIKEANILVSLSDNYVSIHDLQSYALQEKLERTKGAITFAVTSDIVKDPSTGIPSIVSRLAVAVKRKIVLWSWQDTELSPEASEISLIAAVKSLNWATGTKLVAGMDPGFVMVNIESQEVTDINKPGKLGDAADQAGMRFGAVNSSGMGYMGMGGWVPKPMATKLSEGQMLLAKDVNTLFIDAEGKSLEKRQVPWLASPEAIGYSYPYLLALQPAAKGALEVRNPDTLALLQTIAVPNANFLHVAQPNISLAHAGKGFLVASDRCVWRMGALEYDSQIDALVTQGRYDESISLLEMLEDTLLRDKEGRIREIKILKAQGLFDLRKYREAMYLFSEAEAPPERVIALYPRSVAGDVSSIEESKDSESDAEQDAANSETADGSKTSLVTGTTSSSLIGKSVLGRLRGSSKEVDSDTASIKDVSDTASIRGKPTENVPEKPLEGKDLKIAVNELCSFLVQTRTRIRNYMNTDGTLVEALPRVGDSQKAEFKPPFYKLIAESDTTTISDWGQKLYETAVLVDTTLFRGYMVARPTLASSLFRLDNFCEPKVVNEKLYESGRYDDLIYFFQGKKLHRDALELLAKFGKGETDEEVSETLRGPQRTIGYLQQLPPELIDLILEFADWPVKTNPELGMEIFLADTENAETLPRHNVLDFLLNIDVKLGVRYLEHITQELNDLTPEFHQQLIELYLERLKAGDFKDEEEKDTWKWKLEEFLKSSDQYNRARAFRSLPSDNPTFHISRAHVLSKMGQHKQALQIYVFALQDYPAAEDYCNSVFRSIASPISPTPENLPSNVPSTTAASSDHPSIYHTLLYLYLTPPPPHQPAWAPALELLAKHGARLPASQTLALLPASLPVKDLESYFRGRIRGANSVLNQERIERGLRGVERGRCEGELLLGPLDGEAARAGKVEKGGRNRRVVITEEKLCGVCYRRFGSSAVRVYPSGEVVHYGCYDRSGGTGGAGGGMELCVASRNDIAGKVP